MFENPLSDDDYLTREIPAENTTNLDPFFKDQMKIVQSKSFRRLKNKTQVFFAPDNDHICTRMEHSLQVASIASMLCKQLNLRNECLLKPDLAFAIGIGHDIGHTPFGHSGERVLNDLSREHLQKEFHHELNSLRILDHISNIDAGPNNQGLNLTYAVRDGIVCHCGESLDYRLKPRNTIINLGSIYQRRELPSTFEGCVVRLSDRIAYLGRDIEDAWLAGCFEFSDLPIEIVPTIDSNTQNTQRVLIAIYHENLVNNLCNDLVDNSTDNCIKYSVQSQDLLEKLSKFSKEKIYESVIIEPYQEHVRKIIGGIFEYFLKLREIKGTSYVIYQRRGNLLDRKFGNYMKNLDVFYNGTPPAQAVLDYVSGMTDLYALKCWKKISTPEKIDFDIRLPRKK